MLNSELTLEQLQTIVGAGKEERKARRAARKAARQERRDLRAHARRVRRGVFDNWRGCSPNGPCQ